MVLTSEQDIYPKFTQAQCETWDNVHVNGIKTLFYSECLFNDSSKYGYLREVNPWRTMLRINCSDDFYMIHWKTKLALDVALARDDWDIVFRTNNSSYINKVNLFTFCQALPTRAVYGGWFNNDRFVSGAGIFLSRDYCEVLSRQVKEMLSYEEDVLYGDIFKSRGITATFDDRSRLDWPNLGDDYRSAYHIRFKTEERLNDVRNMYLFHKKLYA